MTKIAFLVNSTIKNYAGTVAAINKAFKGSEFAVLSSSHPGHISTLAKKSLEEGVSHIIVIGGDVTLNEAVNGIMSSANDGQDEQPQNYSPEKLQSLHFGLLPAGS